MTWRYPGDGETEQIGKLVDSGHPKLFTALMMVRWIIRGGIVAGIIVACLRAPPIASTLISLVR